MATEIVPRKNAYSPRSAGWTLYRPQDVAEKLGRPLEEVDRVLEETGFNKAVRIRELLIKWKTNLIDEQRMLHKERQALQAQLKKVTQREKEVSEMLINIRNILRIPREKPCDQEEKEAEEALKAVGVDVDE